MGSQDKWENKTKSPLELRSYFPISSWYLSTPLLQTHIRSSVLSLVKQRMTSERIGTYVCKCLAGNKTKKVKM